MQKESTIIKIDICGFNDVAQTTSPQETESYLRIYYDLVSDLISDHGWRLVKCIGDCVLISAEENASKENIEILCEEVRDRFEISAHYRLCEFEETEFTIGEYKCLDVIGGDINNLFLEDASTVSV